ncbi:hypothetical protein [Priestia megaterium]|uniref:hypothetical protein n=1 Tax=Priestia megaterium TaxID=1404 RepID=UPI00211C4429|nr:hypothetical protein [Priestia megaterium]
MQLLMLFFVIAVFLYAAFAFIFALGAIFSSAPALIVLIIVSVPMSIYTTIRWMNK